MSIKRLGDALLFLGREHQREAWQASTVEDLSRVLDRYGLDCALVNASSSRTVNAFRGNEELFAAVEADSRLIPSPSIIPDAGGELGDEESFVDDLIKRGARSVCHHPTTHRTGLDVRVIGKLYEVLQRRRLPVSLFETNLLDAADLAKRYPLLPIILHAPTYRDLTFIPAFKDAVNLHISLMPNFAAFRGVESFVKTFGADRILFATGFPLHEPGAPLAYLAFADISSEDREKIAFGNLERLMKAVQVPQGSTPLKLEHADPNGRARGMCEPAYAGRPIELAGMVDMHAHYGRLRWYPYPDVDGNALVNELDRCGIEKILVSPTPAMTTEVRWSNDRVIAAVKEHPGRIMGYAICYPVTKELGIDEIERAVGAGLHGVKMHNANKIPYDDPGYAPVWRFADEHRLPVLLHTWGDLEPLVSVMEKTTKAPVLLGHAGAGSGAKKYIEFAKRFSNAYLELCWSKVPYGLIEHFVAEVGAERVLWGSDAPAMAVSQQFGRILFADISDEDKHTILVSNPKRILG